MRLSDAKHRRSTDRRGIVGAGVERRSSAGHIDMVHLRRSGIRFHVHRHGDLLVASPGRQSVATITGIGAATPSGARHRYKRQSRWNSVSHRNYTRSRTGPSVRHRDYVGRVLLSLREVPYMRLDDVNHWRWTRTEFGNEGILYAPKSTLECIESWETSVGDAHDVGCAGPVRRDAGTVFGSRTTQIGRIY